MQGIDTLAHNYNKIIASLSRHRSMDLLNIAAYQLLGTAWLHAAPPP
jgi:hypothetical protein